ncbi:MAG: hypothetical protein IKQ64_06140 [Bacteroidales bacterium]|nr:hypothetical protein [Bacteroidales bacterium]
MLKRILLPLAAALALGCIASAQNIKTLENDRYSISNGDVTLTVDAARGAKILSFQCNGKEVLSQSQRPNAFGSTFWTSPQSEWNWPPVPEYDSRPYNAEQKNGALVLTGPTSEKFKYHITKEFRADPADGAIVVTYSITNDAAVERKVAPWEISRVDNGGVIFFDAPSETITPQGLMPFTFEHGATWYQCDEARANRKINADGTGWYAYANNGLLFVKRFNDLGPTCPAPQEAEIQVYVNAGKTYIELEAQGAYTSLKPGESLSWTARWYLFPQDCGDTPSPALLDLVKKVVK